MAVNKKLWETTFEKWPNWPCPSCSTGHLKVIDDTLRQMETGPSVRSHDHIAFEPDWISSRFVALLKCGHDNCGDVVSVCGRQSVFETYDEDPMNEGEQVFIDMFQPLYFAEAPPIFPIPDDCPEEVANEIKRAFSLYWCDPPSCANALRMALERIADDKGIKKGVTLHARIEQLGNGNAEAAKFLMATKWIGNDGSHRRAKPLTHEHLLEDFELFEHALDLLYVKRVAKLHKRAAAIIKRRGVLPKRRSRRRP